MKDKPSKVLECMRVVRGSIRHSDKSYGNNGDFAIPYREVLLCTVASDGDGWDHVSVDAKTATGNRCPTWDEMDYVRKLFFRGDEWVMQLHAPASRHINQHRSTLHLWRPQNETIPTPLPYMA